MGDIAAIAAAHYPVDHIVDHMGARPIEPECASDDCKQRWPCDAAILLARLREVERGWNAASARLNSLMAERDAARADADKWRETLRRLANDALHAIDLQRQYPSLPPSNSTVVLSVDAKAAHEALAAHDEAAR
jgi:predicted TIM-barrel fold metal-dependent hydrolase